MRHAVLRKEDNTWQYRRRVPKSVATVINKSRFIGKLGNTEREAQAAYAAFHADVERQIAAAKLALASADAADQGELTLRQAYDVALDRAEEMAPAGTSWGTREAVVQSIASQYQLNPRTGDPIAASDVDRMTINLVRNSVARVERPSPTLADAKHLYLSDKQRSETPEAFHRTQTEVKRVLGHISAALGRDPVLTDFSREDARRVRDYMQDRRKADGSRINPASVQRDLNTIRAVLNFAALEVPLPASFKNPFAQLGVLVPENEKETDGRKRDPIPLDLLPKIREQLEVCAKPELALIWRILQGTGCRLAEVTGLRVDDVSPGTEFPYIVVAWHEDRRLKTDASRRHVPLVGDALAAAGEALERSQGGKLLFPAYGRARGPDAASAALMKHVRKVTTNRRHTVHSLRHNMKDWLQLAEVSELNQNLILGHALGSTGNRVYGGEKAKLEATTKALQRAVDLASGK